MISAGPAIPAAARPATVTTTTAADEVTASGPAIAVGTLINNNYVIEEAITSGGMGEVFRGANPLTDEKVAIKIILQSLAQDKKVVDLFKREAKILCQLSDPAIVRYLNFVYDQDLGRFCLIMEFIDGIPLSDHVKASGPLDLDATVRLIRRLAHGLHEAHERGVAHRDLSPDNVMLRGGSVEEAVLIDFGIAKSTEIKDSSLHGQFAGKLKYVSPEQLGHFDGHVDRRADIYGLALLVAAAVQGYAIDMGGTIVEAVNARRVIPELDGVYAPLRPLLAHMLEPDPERRPMDMPAVIGMLDNPALIPAQYASFGDGSAAPISGALGAGLGGVSQGSFGPAAGLNQPPSIAAPAVQPPGIAGPSQSPFGGHSAAPFSSLTGPSVAPVADDDDENPRSGLVVGLLLLAVLLGGGWGVYQTGFVQSLLAGSDPAEDPEPVPTERGGLPPPDPATREGFLAAYEMEDCTFATRVTAGRNSGRIEVFSNQTGGLDDLPEAYGAAFGGRPSLVERDIGANHCPVAGFARALQGRGVAAPVLTLDTDVAAANAPIAGRVREAQGRPLWLFLVTEGGELYNLSSFLSGEPDGSFTFSFTFPGAPTGPRLVVAVTSDTALLTAAAATDGETVAEVLPRVTSEIIEKSRQAAVSVAYLGLPD